MKDVYKYKFREMGGRIVVKKKWFSSTVNAYASKKGNRFIVTMYGGLARHELLSDDAFALIVCHEFGHRYNYCNSDDGDIVGIRPRCWFNPECYHF